MKEFLLLWIENLCQNFLLLENYVIVINLRLIIELKILEMTCMIRVPIRYIRLDYNNVRNKF